MVDLKTYFDSACDVLGMSPEELKKRISISHEDADTMLQQTWKRLDPKTEEDILKFYIDNIEYTIYLLRWYHNITADYNDSSLFDNLVKHIPNIKECKILDYGCGQGTFGISMINSGCKHVSFADLPTPLFKIVRHCLTPNLTPNIGTDKFLEIREKYPLKDDYDIIICTDVLGYVKDPGLVFEHLSSHCKYIYLTTFFGGENIPYRLKDGHMEFKSMMTHIIRSELLKSISVEKEFNGLYNVTNSQTIKDDVLWRISSNDLIKNSLLPKMIKSESCNTKDIKIKILFLDHPQIDLGAFNLYNGLCEVLGPENVIVFPFKKIYHGIFDDCKGGYLDFLRHIIKTEPLPYGIPPFQPNEDIVNGWPNVFEKSNYVIQPIQKEYTEDEIISMVRAGTFPFIILASSHRANTIALARIRDKLGGLDKLPPIVYVDNGERDELNEHWVHVFHPKVIFKLVLTPRELLRMREKYGWELFPLPHSSSLANKDIRSLISNQYIKDLHREVLDYITFDGTYKVIDFYYGLGDSYENRIPLRDILGRYASSSTNIVGVRKTGWYDEYLNFMAHSKMVISMRGSARETSRYWEIPLFKSIMICDGTMGCIHPHPFENEKTAVFYDESDLENVPKLIEYYMLNDKERTRIANAGYEHLMKYHTNKARAEYFLGIINNELSENN